MVLISSNQLFAEATKEGVYQRVLWVPPGNDQLVVYEIPNPSALPRLVDREEFWERVAAGDLRPCRNDPECARARPDSELTKAQVRRRKVRYAKLKALLTDQEQRVLYSEGRHALLAETSAASGTGTNHLYAWLRLWWRFGQVENALAPAFQRCGAPGKERAAGDAKRGRPVKTAGTDRGPGINVTEEIRHDLVGWGAVFRKAGRSWQQAYDDTMFQCFRSKEKIDGVRSKELLPPDQRPTLAQFKYWVGKALGPLDVERATKGIAYVERNRAERTGFSMDVPMGPGCIYQIDATVADIYLKSRDDPDILVGRPTLYIVTDQATGIIVGFTASLAPPSWEVAKLALLFAMSPKPEACAELGVEGVTEEQWPCKHKPVQVTGDRGKDVLGIASGTAQVGMEIVVANLLAYRPELKALVEGRFELLDHDAIQWAPGAVQTVRRGELGRRPHQEDGLFDLDGFRRFMVHAIIRYNNTHKLRAPPTWYKPAGAKTPTPVEVWSYGVAARGSPRVVSREFLRANLLPARTARQTDRGLKVGRLHYAPASGAALSAFDRFPGRKWREVKVRHDPGDVSSVFVQRKGGGFEPYWLIPADRRFQGWQLDEVVEFLDRRIAADFMAEKERLEHEARFRDSVDVLKQEAKAEDRAFREATGRVASGKRYKLSADKEARSRERRERRGEEALTKRAGQPGTPPALPAPAAPTPAPESGAQAFPRSLRPDMTALLRRIRDETKEE